VQFSPFYQVPAKIHFMQTRVVMAEIPQRIPYSDQQSWCMVDGISETGSRH